MTDPTLGYSQPRASAGPSSRADVAKDEAAAVGQTAVERAGTVAETAGEQAKEVAAETRRQASDLMHEGQGKLREQARDAQLKAARSLHTLADQFQDMSAKTDDSGAASGLVKQASERAHDVAFWFESREPGDVINDLRAFARRSPGIFLGGAVIAGVLAGRLTKGVVAAGGGDTRPATRTTATEGDADTMRGREMTTPAYPPPTPPVYPPLMSDNVGGIPQTRGQGTRPAAPQSDLRSEWS